MTLRDFKNVFASKPYSYNVVVFYSDGLERFKLVYDSLVEFYSDSYCDLFTISFISLYEFDNKFEIFISLSK